MKIRILWNVRGSEDGFIVRRFHQDCIYTVGKNITDTLARSFLVKGCAEKVEERMAA